MKDEPLTAKTTVPFVYVALRQRKTSPFSLFLPTKFDVVLKNRRLYRKLYIGLVFLNRFKIASPALHLSDIVTSEGKQVYRINFAQRGNQFFSGIVQVLKAAPWMNRTL